MRLQSSFLSRYARNRESGSTLKTLCVMNKKPSYSEIWLFAPPVSSRYTVNKNPDLYVPKSAVGRQLGRRETRNSRQYRLYSSGLYRYCTVPYLPRGDPTTRECPRGLASTRARDCLSPDTSSLKHAQCWQQRAQSDRLLPSHPSRACPGSCTDSSTVRRHGARC